MEEILNNLGIVGFLAMVIWKLLETFVFSKKDNFKDFGDRLELLETNHIVHIEGDLKEIKDELVRQGNRVSILETKVK